MGLPSTWDLAPAAVQPGQFAHGSGFTVGEREVLTNRPVDAISPEQPNWRRCYGRAVRRRTWDNR
jgi:hypothetical protein